MSFKKSRKRESELFFQLVIISSNKSIRTLSVISSRNPKNVHDWGRGNVFTPKSLPKNVPLTNFVNWSQIWSNTT